MVILSIVNAPVKDILVALLPIFNSIHSFTMTVIFEKFNVAIYFRYTFSACFLFDFIIMVIFIWYSYFVFRSLCHVIAHI